MRTMGQDPICGRRVDEGTRYSSVYKGVRYLFCSACCKELFDAVPDETVAARANDKAGKSREVPEAAGSKDDRR